MRIGFLGLGKMGTPMALRLIAAGNELAVWNRSEGRTKPAIHEGAIAAGTPAEAELGADAVITMLFDDAAYEEVVFGPNGLMDALSPGGLHISCSTISVALSERLTVEYAKRGIEFVAAPVFGRPSVAEEGRLWVVAAGTEKAVDRARPLLEAFSRGITVVGQEPRQAHAVKLGGNFLISAMIHSLGEAFVFADAAGNRAGDIFRSHQQRAVSVAVLCGVRQDHAASAGAPRGDDRAGRERSAPAARSGRGPRDASEPRRPDGGDLRRGARTGLGDEDWAVGQYRMAQRRGVERAS